MAKYRVYLKDGMGVFVAEATTIEVEDCYYNLFDNNEHVALFDKASVLVIINTDKAERAFASGGVVSGECIVSAEVSKAEERLKNLFPHSLLWEEETPDDMKGQPLKGEEEC